MGLNHVNLNETTRRFMLLEFETGHHFLSPRLADAAKARWPDTLRDALQYHTDVWLERELIRRNMMLGTETLKSPMGGKTITRAINKEQAAKSLAEGEFNRYYMRGVCLAAKARGFTQVIVAAGKIIPIGTKDLQKAVGVSMHVDAVLENLRMNNYTKNDAILGAPMGSGLSAFLTLRMPQAGEAVIRRPKTEQVS